MLTEKNQRFWEAWVMNQKHLWQVVQGRVLHKLIKDQTAVWWWWASAGVSLWSQPRYRWFPAVSVWSQIISRGESVIRSVSRLAPLYPFVARVVQPDESNPSPERRICKTGIRILKTFGLNDTWDSLKKVDRCHQLHFHEFLPQVAAMEPLIGFTLWLWLTSTEKQWM